MRCYTLTERDELVRGIRITREHEVTATTNDAGNFGVRIGPLFGPVERKVNDHLRACEGALYKRAEGEATPSPLLGESDRAVLSDDDAMDVLEEVTEGWFVDHLTVDPETGILMHIPYDARDTRCMLLVAPSIDQGGSISYQSNLPANEGLIRGRVIRTFAPIDKAAGIEQVYGDGSWSLLKLDMGASFRIYRKRCQQGWKECLVRWNGRVLRKRAFGGVPLRNAA